MWVEMDAKEEASGAIYCSEGEKNKTYEYYKMRNTTCRKRAMSDNSIVAGYRIQFLDVRRSPTV